MFTIFTVIAGTSLGVSMAAPPGPITAMIVDRARASVKKGMLVGLGAMTADFMLMIFVLYLRNSVNFSFFYDELYGIGGAYFIILGVSILRNLPEAGIDQKMKNEQSYYGYIRGFATGIMNPLQIGWWLTAGISVINSEGVAPFYFFYPGITLYLIVFSIIVKKSYLKWGIKFEMAASLFSVGILFIFGIYFFLILAMNLNLVSLVYIN